MNALQIGLGTIDQPGKALTGAAERPRLWWVAALLILVSLVALTAITASQAVDLANERSAAVIDRVVQAQSLSAEQAQAIRDRGQAMTQQRYWLTTAGLGMLLAGLGWVLRAAVIHFSSMALGGRSLWPATFAITVWRSCPSRSAMWCKPCLCASMGNCWSTGGWRSLWRRATG